MYLRWPCVVITVIIYVIATVRVETDINAKAKTLALHWSKENNFL